MRKIILFIALLTLSLVVVACGTTKKVNNQTQGKQAVEDINNDVTKGTDGNAGTNGANGNAVTNTNEEAITGNQDDLAKMDELDYEEFKLDINYGNLDEYDAELERERGNTIKAEIDDSINGVKKRGTDAFNELYPLVKKLTINQQTTKEEAIKDILDVFNLKNDYTKFEMEIKLKDGTRIEFEDIK